MFLFSFDGTRSMHPHSISKEKWKENWLRFSCVYMNSMYQNVSFHLYIMYRGKSEDLDISREWRDLLYIMCLHEKAVTSVRLFAYILYIHQVGPCDTVTNANKYLNTYLIFWWHYCRKSVTINGILNMIHPKFVLKWNWIVGKTIQLEWFIFTTSMRQHVWCRAINMNHSIQYHFVWFV